MQARAQCRVVNERRRGGLLEKEGHTGGLQLEKGLLRWGEGFDAHYLQERGQADGGDAHVLVMISLSRWPFGGTRRWGERNSLSLIR